MAVVLFLATLVSVFFTYGWFFQGENPLASPELTRDSALFAGALMSVLLAHELGHYFVARRHGFSLSLPYFIPFPAAFGTLGAIIRLESLPRSRTALLEMGAAGPLAGAVVAVILLCLGLPGTEAGPEVILLSPDAAPPAWMAAIDGAFSSLMSWGPLAALSNWLSPPVPEGHLPVVIFHNPPVMDWLGSLLNGSPPGRFDVLSPLALAGWVGCFLTALNLLPVGQLDGGHVFNALAPEHARRVSKLFLLVLLCGGLLWGGWVFWAVLLWMVGAWQSLDVPSSPVLTRRARIVGVLTLLLFLVTFMPRPLEMDSLPVSTPPQAVESE